MKSSSPPPPRAAALRSRRGGGDGPAARQPGPRRALPLHPHRRSRRSRGNTRARLPGSLRGAVPSAGCGGGPGDPPQARRRHGPLRPAPAVPSRGSPPRPRAARRSRSADGAYAPRSGPCARTASSLPARPAVPRWAAGNALQGRRLGRASPGRAVCPGLAVWRKMRFNSSCSCVGSLFPLSPPGLRALKRSWARALHKCSALWDAGELLCQWLLLCAWKGRTLDRRCGVLKVTWVCFPLTKGALVFLRPSSKQHVYFYYLRSAEHILGDRQACKEGWIPITVFTVPWPHLMCMTSTAMLVHRWHQAV